MAYFNVHIPDRFSLQEKQRQQIADLKHQVEFQEKQLTRYQDILENIPLSVREHGFVEISFEGEKIILIKKPEDPTPTHLNTN